MLPALEANLIEMTIPGKPKSSKQRYRLTPSSKTIRARSIGSDS
ncbi:MAG: Fic family protein [Pirellula sp.]